MVLLMCLTVFAACVPGLRLWSKTENHVLLGHNVAQVRGVANATTSAIRTSRTRGSMEDGRPPSTPPSSGEAQRVGQMLANERDPGA